MSCIEMVRKFVVDNFLFGNAKELKDNTSFMEEGIIDSTGILELVFFLEETFGMRIEDEELIPENMDSLQNIARFVAGKLDHDSTAEG
ncbi:MAG: acyl carrier protein [Phycisphaerales bacterium]|nr:MAG: acyl carrier protein [Phycisphaerales bacterium]